MGYHVRGLSALMYLSVHVLRPLTSKCQGMGTIFDAQGLTFLLTSQTTVGLYVLF